MCIWGAWCAVFYFCSTSSSVAKAVLPEAIVATLASYMVAMSA